MVVTSLLRYKCDSPRSKIIILLQYTVFSCSKFVTSCFQYLLSKCSFLRLWINYPVFLYRLSRKYLTRFLHVTKISWLSKYFFWKTITLLLRKFFSLHPFYILKASRFRNLTKCELFFAITLWRKSHCQTWINEINLIQKQHIYAQNILKGLLLSIQSCKGSQGWRSMPTWDCAKIWNASNNCWKD